ncbi:hypothetical protein [Barnesiella intestinihominis]|jgi:hypothetical protein|uniref:hypothetical protein n=1 Tax=Barnesiella intestinihominis TaxID=487174 RepID=UPI003FEE3405
MEIQEQQFVRELAESRMQIELLRNRVLLRYYAQLLELDIMEQTQEVKALMSSINTLERYARKYEPKESAIESAPVENGGSGEVSRNKEGESECVDVLSGKTMPCVSARSGVESMTAVPYRSATVRNLPNGLKIKSVTTRGKSHRK